MRTINILNPAKGGAAAATRHATRPQKAARKGPSERPSSWTSEGQPGASVRPGPAPVFPESAGQPIWVPQRCPAVGCITQSDPERAWIPPLEGQMLSRMTVMPWRPRHK